jgi:uncharacterized protein YxjI
MQSGDGLLSQPALVINQKMKLFELRNEFAILDGNGERIGSVTQVNQSLLTKLLRIFSDADVMLPVTLEVSDAAGTPVLHIHKPWFRITAKVSRPDGQPIGDVAKQIRLGKTRFAMRDAAGIEVGSVIAENWRARDFRIEDRNGIEVARISKKWRGLARELFTDADTYAVELPPTLSDPLRSLAAATALAIDTIMKQKDYASPTDAIG